jgi:hypothetical protein
MATTFLRRSASRVILIVALIGLAALLVIPRVSGQESQTLELEIDHAEESLEVAPAYGNDPTDDTPFARGDVFSGQGAVYADGDTAGERTGTFYFMGVITAEPEYFETAANHYFGYGYFELFDAGTLSIGGVVNFNGPYQVAILGGTGSYAGAVGHCTVTPTEAGEHWECEIR